MKIEIRRASSQQCEYTITREDGSVEVIALDIKTYLLHDICHYVVEKNLAYADGFWGMLAQGRSFQQLFGKENPQTEVLRAIEHIVGPVQSVYWGHVPKADFPQYIQYTGLTVPEEVLDACLAEIELLMQAWELLALGEPMELEWTQPAT